MERVNEQQQQHVVAVPIAAQGHINPLMRFCQLLAKQQGFTVTFVDFDPIHARLQEVQHSAAPDDAANTPPPLIRRTHIPIPSFDLSNDFNISISRFFSAFPSITSLRKSTSPSREEFQDGLISSKQRFLWVFQRGLVHDINYFACVASIISKSHGRGFVISWAPQMQVLEHPSVGGFLTHCGWNLTTKAIINAVPMLCWPYYADQPLNARCIMDDWKVGLGFKTRKQDNGLIEREEVEKVIQALMEGEEGRVVRKNARDLKERSYQCFLESGSSSIKLKALITSLLVLPTRSR
ncbi:hypothetical protein L7F22_055939 [Adiantum nelumboides]|nr:hypothetical protein [Adiantum nelumboides]